MKTLLFVVILVSVLAVPVFSIDGYPYTAIGVPDPWGFLTCESTSYAAWYLNVVEGYHWYNTQPGLGSARYWDEIANTLGWTVSSVPQIGAVISWKTLTPYGHVAIVEAVNSDGTLLVSEYNWVRYSLSYRNGVHPDSYGNYVYIYHSIPEPSSLIALGALLAPLLFRRRR